MPASRLLARCGWAVLFGSPFWAADAPAERDVTLFPGADAYPEYIADPHRRAFGVKLLQYDRTEIPASSNSRLQVKLGGRIGMARLEASSQDDSVWQLSLEGGFDAQFDNRHGQDNVGWDGYYGALLTRTATATDWALKLGLMHLSSHVGDEYAQRTGRQRIEYTREEALAGVAIPAAGGVLSYVEVGYAYELRNPDLQRPWRVQTGAQVEQPTRRWPHRLDWYGALDLTSMQERNWRVDASVQTGLAWTQAGQRWRIGLEWYQGRPTIGEFFQATERFFALGVWLNP